MSYEAVLQTPDNPASTLAALENIAGADIGAVRLGIAYVTSGGCNYLIPRLADRIGDGWGALPKTLVTCFDFGMTEPKALRALRDEHGFELRKVNRRGSNYHPKLFLLSDGGPGGCYIGSANLTRRALTTNTEMGVAISFQECDDSIATSWRMLLEMSAPIDEDQILQYEEARTTSPPPLPPDPPPQPSATPSDATGLQTLTDAVEAGLDPSTHDSFWVEAGSMSSSGSHSQLELPRSANRYFGFSFTGYDNDHHTIGSPTFVSGGQRWDDRPLTWHGNNRMERVNLPTPHQGGFEYRETAILFRRISDGFQIQVAPWNSEIAQSWRGASAKKDLTFRLGRNSPRICGFF